MTSVLLPTCPPASRRTKGFPGKQRNQRALPQNKKPKRGSKGSLTTGGVFPEGRERVGRGRFSRNGCLLPSQVQRVEFQGRGTKGVSPLEGSSELPSCVTVVILLFLQDSTVTLINVFTECLLGCPSFWTVVHRFLHFILISTAPLITSRQWGR